jgi:glycosyltransferase involved in cell wall biosynthesis
VHNVPFLPVYPFHVHLHGLFVTRLLKSLEQSFDVVHVHLPLPPFVHTSLPTVVTVHALVELERYPSNYLADPYLMAERLFSKFLSAIELKAMRNADVITTVSRFEAREIERHYGFDARKVLIASGGVDTEFFVPGTKRARSPYVLYAGRLDSRKGLIDLVKSAKDVHVERPDVRFVLAGGGFFGRYLRRMIRDMKLDSMFYFTGNVPIDTLLKYYQYAALCVLPSYSESLGLALLEAMACGTPVVASSGGAISEIVVDGKTGFLVPPRDPKALAKSILRLVNDTALRERFGKSSRDRVERYYGWDIVSERFIDCYESAAAVDRLDSSY